MTMLYMVAIDRLLDSVVISNLPLPNIIPREAAATLSDRYKLVCALPLALEPTEELAAWRHVPDMESAVLDGLAYSAIAWAIETAFLTEQEKADAERIAVMEGK